MEGGNIEPHRGLARRHGDREETARRTRRTTSSPTREPASPFPGPASISSAGARCKCAGKNEHRVETKTLTPRTDDDGQLQVPTAELDDQQRKLSSGLITAATPEGRLAHLGFTNIWAFGRRDSAYDQVKVYTITDRPVYRPGAPVRFKFWVAQPRYDQPDAADFAGQTFNVEIQNPKGEKIFTKTFTADKFGGFDGSFELPSDAALGVYQVYMPNRGGGSFRVEEYKKPEFEVASRPRRSR